MSSFPISPGRHTTEVAKTRGAPCSRKPQASGGPSPTSPNRILARAWVGNNETDENETGLGTGGKINREGQGRSLRGIRGSEHVNGRG